MAPPPATGLRYESFTDPSGGSADSMTCAIGHLQGNVVVLDALREVTAPFDPVSVTSEFVGLFRRYGIRRTNGDRYAAEWSAQAFAKEKCEYRHCETPRSGLYLNLLPHLNSRTIRLLDAPRAINQICSLERRTARGARDTIDHPRGLHDDVANAIAGLAYVVTNRREAVPPDFATWSDLRPSRLRRQQLADQQAARNVAGGSAPCTINFAKLEPKPLPEGLTRKFGPPRIWWDS
jgi:hypothetical protein